MTKCVLQYQEALVSLIPNQCIRSQVSFCNRMLSDGDRMFLFRARITTSSSVLYPKCRLHCSPAVQVGNDSHIVIEKLQTVSIPPFSNSIFIYLLLINIRVKNLNIATRYNFIHVNIISHHIFLCLKSYLSSLSTPLCRPIPSGQFPALSLLL